MTDAQIVSFVAPPRTPDEERIIRLYNETSTVIWDKGFRQPPKPRFVFGLPDEQDLLRLATERVRYVQSPMGGMALYFNLGAINGVSAKQTAEFQQSLRDDPELAAQLGSVKSLMAVQNPAAGPANDLEIMAEIASAFGHHFAWLINIEEELNSWLFRPEQKNHKQFASEMILGGISEYFTRLVVGISEGVSSDIWKRYDEDPELEQQGFTRQWFIDKGGWQLIAPILDSYKEAGVRYLLTNQLRINRHFSLKGVPRYRTKALKELRQPLVA